MKANELRIGNLVYYMDDTYSDREKKIEDNIFKITLVSEKVIKIDIGFGAVQRFEENPIWSPRIEQLKPIHLTEEWLKRLGFKYMKCISSDWEKEWIINPQKYSWEIGVLLGDYPEDNPNCGCVSILQSKNIKAKGVPPDLLDKEDWTEEDVRRADKYRITLEKWRQPIAYFIRYVHQLQNLYFALTGEELMPDTGQ